MAALRQGFFTEIPLILRQSSRGHSRDAVAVSRKITSRDTVHGRSLREVRERTPSRGGIHEPS